MTRTLAIGAYAANDAAALAEHFDATMIASLDALADLPASARNRIEAVAYKSTLSYGADEMALTPNLRLIANFGVGYDAINVKAATERGVQVTNSPDVLNDDVADSAILLLLGEARRVVGAAKWLEAGSWAEKGEYPLARKMSGRKVGVLGMGRIGREIANRLAAFKCDIHYHARSEKETPNWTYHADPVSLCRAVDDVVISIVGGPDTVNYVTAEAIAALGPDGVIVNIARGSVIDEAALIEALETGRIRGAGLDVFRNEPRIDPRFARMENVLALPHIGSATVETRAAMGALQRRNLAAVLAREAPVTPVNKV